MNKCLKCSKEGSVELRFQNIDGSYDIQFYCVPHARQEFQKVWRELK